MQQVMLRTILLSIMLALALATYWPHRRPSLSPLILGRQSRTLPYRVQQGGYYQDSSMMSYVPSGSTPSHSSRSIIYTPTSTYSHIVTPITWTQRPIYTGMPIYTSYVSPPTSFSKRFDQVQSSSYPTSSMSGERHKPCLFDQLASNQYPVYVLPPKNFQPIIYQQNSPFSGYLTPIPIVFHEKTKTKNGEELWYETDEAVLKQNKYQSNQVNQIISKVNKKKVVLVPLEETNVGEVPIFEAAVVADNTQGSLSRPLSGEATRETLNPNPYNLANKTGPVMYEKGPRPKDTRRYKTKLPVGLSSFLLGGVRGVSGRHWHLPLEVTSSLEFMPNLNPTIAEPYYPESSKPSGETEQQPVITNDSEQSEKEETSEEQSRQSNSPRSSFAGNSILDTEMDLEAQESSQEPAQAVLPTSRS